MAIIDLKALLGAAIKHERSALRISQEELAYRAGLHRTYVSDVERGARNPSLESVAKLADALELSLATLFERATGNETQQIVEILLVEDNPRDAQVTLRELEKARITNPLHVVRDGAEALDFVFATGSYTDRAEIRRPQIILLDLSLPKKSGLEVLLAIKADKRTQEIPIIVLTASNRGHDINECRRLGVVTHIAKPVRFQKFTEAVQHFQFDWALLKPSRVSASQQGFRRR